MTCRKKAPAKIPTQNNPYILYTPTHSLITSYSPIPSIPYLSIYSLLPMRSIPIGSIYSLYALPIVPMYSGMSSYSFCVLSFSVSRNGWENFYVLLDRGFWGLCGFGDCVRENFSVSLDRDFWEWVGRPDSVSIPYSLSLYGLAGNWLL